jgi:hypothetical protein
LDFPRSLCAILSAGEPRWALSNILCHTCLLSLLEKSPWKEPPQPNNTHVQNDYMPFPLQIVQFHCSFFQRSIKSWITDSPSEWKTFHHTKAKVFKETALSLV